jgi:hypothetical protein
MAKTRTERFQELRADYAKQLRREVGDRDVELAATVHFAIEGIQDRLRGGDTSVTLIEQLGALNRQLKEIAPPQPPRKIQLGLVGNPKPCKKCGYVESEEVVNPGGDVTMAEGLRQKRLREEAKVAELEAKLDAPTIQRDPEPGSDAPPAPENASAATPASAKQDPQKAEEKAVGQMPYHERMLRRAPGSADLHHMVPGTETGSNPYGVGPPQTGQVSQPQEVAPDESPVVWFGSRKNLYK